MSGSRTRAKRLAKELTDQGATAFYSEDPERELRPGEVEVFYGHSAHGFEYPELKFTVIADTDIFGAEQTKVRKKKPRHTGAGAIRSLDDLHVGDYVVHEDQSRSSTGAAIFSMFCPMISVCCRNMPRAATRSRS